MVKHLVICTLCIALAACEQDLVSDAKHVDEERHFYVAIFDGYFPIPVRYKLGPLSSMSKRISFTSSTLPPGFSLNETLDKNQLTGLISISTIEECIFCNNHEQAINFLGEYQKLHLDKNVHVLKSMSTDETNAVFFNDKMFIYVMDDDPELYSELIENIDQGTINGGRATDSRS